MIELRISKQNTFERDMPDGRGNRARRKAPKLFANVRGCVEEEPAVTVAADRYRGLSAGPGGLRITSRNLATGTPTVPLGETAAGGAPQEENVHSVWGMWAELR